DMKAARSAGFLGKAPLGTAAHEGAQTTLNITRMPPAAALLASASRSRQLGAALAFGWRSHQRTCWRIHLKPASWMPAMAGAAWLSMACATKPNCRPSGLAPPGTDLTGAADGVLASLG